MPNSDLLDFNLSNARRFYSSKGDPLGTKGLSKNFFFPLWYSDKSLLSEYLLKNFFFPLWYSGKSRYYQNIYRYVNNGDLSEESVDYLVHSPHPTLNRGREHMCNA